MTEIADDKIFVDELWVYSGKRIWNEGFPKECLVSQWIDEEGRAQHYDVIKGKQPIIGGIYKTQVCRKDNGVTTNKLGSGYVKLAKLDADTRLKYQVSHRAAEQYFSAKKKGKSKEFEVLDRDVIAPLKDALRDCSYQQKRVFLAYLLERIL
jgi:hypothetical protein